MNEATSSSGCASIVIRRDDLHVRMQRDDEDLKNLIEFVRQVDLERGAELPRSDRA
jgi:hypothetical protein